DREDDSPLLHAGLVADALDLEALLKALGNALNHVVDQAAGQAVQGTVLPLVVGARDLDGLGLLIVLDAHVWMIGQFELAPGPPGPALAIGPLDLDAGRNGHRLLADSRHGDVLPFYQTVQSSSPPSRSARARRSLMTPRLVLNTEIPRPSSTGCS